MKSNTIHIFERFLELYDLDVMFATLYIEYHQAGNPDSLERYLENANENTVFLLWQNYEAFPAGLNYDRYFWHYIQNRWNVYLETCEYAGLDRLDEICNSTKTSRGKSGQLSFLPDNGTSKGTDSKSSLSRDLPADNEIRFDRCRNMCVLPAIMYYMIDCIPNPRISVIDGAGGEGMTFQIDKSGRYKLSKSYYRHNYSLSSSHLIDRIERRTGVRLDGKSRLFIGINDIEKRSDGSLLRFQLTNQFRMG